MVRSLVRVSLLVLSGALFLFACTQATPLPTQEPSIYFTQAAETISADFTRQAAVATAARTTQVVVLPSETPSPPPTATASPAPTETPTVTSIPPTATLTPQSCDKAQLVADISVKDNAIFTPGAGFTKIWRLRNTGTCTWTDAYAVVLSDGQAASVSAVALPGRIRPGSTVDIAVPMAAPSRSGNYTDLWMLRNPLGVLFGLGETGTAPLTVIYRVVPYSVSNSVAYDFITNYCLAAWNNQSDYLPCPGSENDPNGYITLLDRPVMEGNRGLGIGLWTKPGSGENGWITGDYPYYLVQPGDSFMAELGCLDNNPRCDVIFRLDYQTNLGTSGNLYTRRETSDGATHLVSIDLSPLVGKLVRFFLTVQNDGTYGDAEAVWLAPRVENITRNRELILTWRRAGGSPAVCEEMGIYLNGDQSGEARAFDCINGRQEIASSVLTAQEIAQFTNWVEVYRRFDAEIFSTTTGEPIRVLITLSGRGDANASRDDIHAIHLYVENLFNIITP